jgi:ABC-type multidrug transport system fused ATPase/permease subunit
LVQGANAATIGVLGSAVVIASEVAVLLVLMIGLMVVDFIVALFTVVFFGLVGWTIYRILGEWARRLGERLSSTEIASITSAQNAVRTYREVTVTGRRGILIDRFRGLRWEAARVQADMQIMSQVSKYIFEIALIVGAGLLALSQFLTRDVIAAVAVIAVFLTAATRIMPALLRLQAAVLGVRSASGVASPTLELAKDFPDVEDESALDPQLKDRVVNGIVDGHPDFRPSISLHDVTLSYPGADEPAVSHVSLCVDPGESLALVGPTGAGKSTTADVILGVIAPDQGEVVMSGVNPTVAARTWPGAIAYVPQDITVLDGTIRDNIALGLPLEIVDDGLVWEALERAHLDSVVRQEREGLDTIVGENGVRLSGGQRQRLGLARALYTRPRLIVLDEATSALDAETELAVSTALNELAGEVTLIIVAHRLATIRNCTSVAYIEDGRVAAQGTFAEVRTLQPNFDKQAELLGL